VCWLLGTGTETARKYDLDCPKIEPFEERSQPYKSGRLPADSSGPKRFQFKWTRKEVELPNQPAPVLAFWHSNSNLLVPPT